MKAEYFNESQKINIQNKYKPLKEILKEKILYDHICPLHHSNYIKYCSTCKKDICNKCIELHNNHIFITYENLLPNLKETNIMKEIIKEYEKYYNSLINIINYWKREFDILLNEYETKINNIIDFMSYFDNEKVNFYSIYKYRIIYSMLLSDDKKKENNNKIIEMMDKLYKDKVKENQNIKKEYQGILNNNKLREIISSLNNNDSFLNKCNIIIELINPGIKNIKEIKVKNLEKKINTIVINSFLNKDKDKDKNIKNNNNIDITPCFNNKKNKSSSGKNHNTSASSIENNINKKLVFENDDSNSNSNSQYKKNNGVINLEYTFSKKDIKKKHSKSLHQIKHNKKINNLKLCIYEKKKIRQKSNDYINNNKKINLTLNNNGVNILNKLNKNTLQNSINDTKIFLFHKPKKANSTYNNIISDKTQNILNKTFLHDYKGFDINDKESGPELLNDTSSIIQGVKYVSHSFRNNSIENINNNKYGYFNGKGRKINLKSHSIDNNIKNMILIDKNNDYGAYNDYDNNLINKINGKTFNLSRNINNNFINMTYNNNSIDKSKKNNSVENINNKKFINSDFINNTYNNIKINDKINTNRIYYDKNDKKIDNNIYVQKKCITLDFSKTLTSVDSITSSIQSTNSNKNYINCNNNIFLNKNNNNNTNIYNKNMIKNKTYNSNKLKNYKLYLGLEIGNNECKIGFINNNNYNNFELYNINNNYYKAPTIISFISNISNKQNIKIGEEAEKLRITNASQTIFNIIKIFGKNSDEIIGRKDLWPFTIYNEPKTNIPVIKIKYGNNNDNKKNKYVYYNFEELLSIYLKKFLENFFNKIILNNNEDTKNNYYNMNINKYIDINIDITVSVPNYYNYLQRLLIKKIFINDLFPKNEINQNKNLSIKKNIYGKYNIQLNDIKIENCSNLPLIYIMDKSVYKNNNIQKFFKNNLVLVEDGGSVNISIINLSKNNNNYFIEIKSVNSSEFGDEDFLDNFIYDCLSDFKEKIRKNCLNSPSAMAKLRKSLNSIKKSFDKEELNQTEVNINKLYAALDLKMIVNKNIYHKSCTGLFRKIIYLIKDTILNSNMEIKDLNDIILIGNIFQNIKLKNMISEIFKDDNKLIYNILTNKNNENDNDINNYIIYGAIIQCLNNNMTIPKYKLINITNSSFGIESLNGLMDIVIEKGSNIPIKFNKYIKIKKPHGNENHMANINIYEGENKYVTKNKLIANNLIDIKNFKNEKKEDNYIELLFQFFIDSYYNLNVYILDKNTFKREFECLIDLNN